MKTVIINGIEMSYEQAHRMLWNWLADNPIMNKRDFFNENKCSIQPLHNCFACDLHKYYDDDFEWDSPNCDRCPLKWGTEEFQESCFCESDDNEFMSLYDEWCLREDNALFMREMEKEKLSNLARKIANMEWRDNE